MRRIYKFPLKDYITSGSKETIITNGFGSYFADAPTTSYQGWYQLRVKDWRMQKILESLIVLDEGEQTALYQQFYGLRRLYKSGAQDIIIPYRKALLYESVDIRGRVLASFDHRESYEGSAMGRYYTVFLEDDIIIIHFKKEQGSEEFVAIKGARNVEILGSWKEKHYETDKKRGVPDNYWVYDACTFIPSTKVVFATGETKDEAKTLADIAYHHFEEIVSNTHEHVFRQLPYPEHVVHSQLFAAGTCAAWSLQSLHQRFFFEKHGFTGIYAGLPWFFQIWSRDELVSLKGLMQIAQANNDEVLFGEIKKLLERQLKSVDKDGRLANRFPASTLGSADALGWLAKRITDFVSILKEEKQLYNFFSIPELIGWSERLKVALKKVTEHQMQDGLVYSHPKETWMDTTYQDDGRPGFRIEIQALHDALLTAILYLEKLVGSPHRQEFVKAQQTFREKVRETFLQPHIDGVILDGVFQGRFDKTIRPNVFLAAYLAPNLFSKKDWIACFDDHIEKLYLPWGGFATINQQSSLFQPVYTGQDNKSYHRGDSWYFVNNLAAIVLFSFHEEKYASIAKEILYASAKDITDFGFAGHASELSSAATQTGEASLAQAWSAATFIELLETIYPADY